MSLVSLLEILSPKSGSFARLTLAKKLRKWIYSKLWLPDKQTGFVDYFRYIISFNFFPQQKGTCTINASISTAGVHRPAGRQLGKFRDGPSHAPAPSTHFLDEPLNKLAFSSSASQSAVNQIDYGDSWLYGISIYRPGALKTLDINDKISTYDQ